MRADEPAELGMGIAMFRVKLPARTDDVGRGRDHDEYSCAQVETFEIL